MISNSSELDLLDSHAKSYEYTFQQVKRRLLKSFVIGK